MGQLGSTIGQMGSHIPQALQIAGGVGASAMGQPELGLPMLASGMSSMAGSPMGPNATPGSAGDYGNAISGMAPLAQAAFGRPGGMPQQQPPPMPPRPQPQPPQQGGMPGGMGGMMGGGAPGPQAAGMMGGAPPVAGAGGGQNPMMDPQFAAKIRQMMMGGQFGAPGM